MTRLTSGCCRPRPRRGPSSAPPTLPDLLPWTPRQCWRSASPPGNAGGPPHQAAGRNPCGPTARRLTWPDHPSEPPGTAASRGWPRQAEIVAATPQLTVGPSSQCPAAGITSDHCRASRQCGGQLLRTLIRGASNPCSTSLVLREAGTSSQVVCAAALHQ